MERLSRAPDPRASQAPPIAPTAGRTDLAGVLEEHQLAHVVGTVWTGEGVLPEGWVESRDCQVSGRVVDGDFELFVAAEGWCELRAVRMDGLLRTASAPIQVELVPGETALVDLELPVERRGGLGVQIEAVDGGFQVVRVVPGAPAERMGLVPGDLIVEVDGLAAAELETQDFIDALTGPEGSQVDFRVAFEGDTGGDFEDLVLTRQVLGEEAPPAPAEPEPAPTEPLDTGEYGDSGAWESPRDLGRN